MIWLIIKEAWLSLSSHKLRTFLTTLGIIIGVSAVVMMVAAGQTVQNMINDSLAGMGSNLLMIRPEFVTTSGVKSGGQTVVKTDDADVIRKLKYIKAVSPMVNGTDQVVYGNENYTASVVASSVVPATSGTRTSLENAVNRATVLMQSTSRTARTFLELFLIISFPP